MQLKWSTFLFLLCFDFHAELKAEVRSSLFLRSFNPPSIKTSIQESKLNSSQTLWLLSSQVNSLYPLEGQKFEVEGLSQSGMDAQIKKVINKDRTVQHEILISRLKSTMKENKIIFLKISAN